MPWPPLPSLTSSSSPPHAIPATLASSLFEDARSSSALGHFSSCSLSLQHLSPKDLLDSVSQLQSSLTSGCFDLFNNKTISSHSVLSYLNSFLFFQTLIMFLHTISFTYFQVYCLFPPPQNVSPVSVGIII